MYSNWQILRIRRALDAFYTHNRLLGDEIDLSDPTDGTNEKHVGSRDSDWDDVADAIYEYSGVRPGAERLRSFVKGNKGKYTIPEDPSLAAIAKFLTHEDIDLLSEQELGEYVPTVQAPLRLLEFLDPQPGAERILPPAELAGTYEVRFLDGEYIVIRELALQKPSKDGMLEVAEIDEIYETEEEGPKLEDTFLGGKAKLHERIISKGWAVITPEDNILFFLKNQENGRNRIYVSLALDDALWTEGTLDGLVLYDQSHTQLYLGSKRQEKIKVPVPRVFTERKAHRDMEPRVLLYRRVSDEVGSDKFRGLINP